MFFISSSQIPRVLRTIDHVTAAYTVGNEPSRELATTPAWIVFRSTDDFKTDSFSEFTITNQEHCTVAYCFRTKLQLFRVFPQSYGVLRPLEKKTFKLYLTTEGWSNNLGDVANRLLKILVENIRVPENIRPADDVSGAEMARVIFRNTKTCRPAVRKYMKFVVVLERDVPILYNDK